MKLKGSNIPRNTNPANPFKEVEKPKQLVYYVGLDGCLAYYNRWRNVGDIGEPVIRVKNKVLSWIKKGIIVKIFTARACKKEAIKHIRKWLIINGFPPDLEITNIIGIDAEFIVDCKARECILNTDIIVSRINEFEEKT